MKAIVAKEVAVKNGPEPMDSDREISNKIISLTVELFKDNKPMSAEGEAAMNLVAEKELQNEPLFEFMR